MRPSTKLPTAEALLSPLRFPGSKRRLIPFIKKVLDLNDIAPKLYVEPFVGGASVALQLLFDNLIQTAALSDRDPMIAAFWQSVFFDTNWLVDTIREIKIDIRRWETLKASRPRSRRDRAIRLLYLNRTSFSGIAARTGGPIGGKANHSQYDISCRFPRETVAARVFDAGQLRDRILWVRSLDWKDAISEARKAYTGRARGQEFVYLDPPFYYKADRLYDYHFTHPDHVRLCKYLQSATFPWLLSYDAAHPIIQMYASNGLPTRLLTMLYSASPAAGLHTRRELIATNLSLLPRRRPLPRRS